MLPYYWHTVLLAYKLSELCGIVQQLNPIKMEKTIGKGYFEKRVLFLQKQLPSLIKIALKNRDKIGYVQCFVPANFKKPEMPPKFIEGKFNKRTFEGRHFPQ